jgi:hypothetical protein
LTPAVIEHAHDAGKQLILRSTDIETTCTEWPVTPVVGPAYVLRLYSADDVSASVLIQQEKLTMIRYFTCSFVVLVLAACGVAQDGGFTPLFNGENFDGWEQQGGVAKYRIEDGVIVGESVAGTPNSFMCTKKLYRNFVLEYEYKCDNLLNSGVQFRSNVYAIEVVVGGTGRNRKIAAGRVHGYQVEIDPNKPSRMWSGGIYDEGRRGWLYPGLSGGDAEAFTKQGQDLYKPDEWNFVKVECNGSHIRTWLNGKARADFEDDMTPQGLIALQVHGVGKHPEAVGRKIMWRNLRIKELP